MKKRKIILCFLLMATIGSFTSCSNQEEQVQESHADTTSQQTEVYSLPESTEITTTPEQSQTEIPETTENIEPALYEWHLNPTIQADDVIVVDSDETALDTALIEQYTMNCEIDDNSYDVYSYVAFQKGGNVGIMDYEGNVVQPENNKNSLYYVRGKFQNSLFYDSGFPESMPTSYYASGYLKSLEANGIPYNGGDAVVAFDGENYGIIRRGRYLVDSEYEDGKMVCGGFNGIMALCNNGKWGYFNRNGTQIIDFVCDAVKNAPSGSFNLIITGISDDENGNSIKPLENDYVGDIFMASNGYIPVKVDGEWAYYNYAGEEVIPRGTFAEVRPVHHHLAWVKEKESGLWGVIELPDQPIPIEMLLTEEETSDTPQQDEPASLVAQENVSYKGTRNAYDFTEYFTMVFNRDDNAFYVDIIDDQGSKSGLDLPISGYEAGVYTYNNGNSYYRNAFSGGRVPVASELSGTITIVSENEIIWQNDSIPNVIDEFTITMTKE